MGRRTAMDKVREHSTALRQGICETLVILSVHGNNLFQDRLGIDVEAHVASLIRKLLTSLSLDKLLSHDKDLPRYAEAAPGQVFLARCLKRICKNAEPDRARPPKTSRERFVRFADEDRTVVGAGMPCLEAPRARQLDIGTAIENRYQRQLDQQADL